MRPEISFLSPEEQERIHQAALWLLENVGMQMPCPEALAIMKKGGAKIEDDSTAKIPRELVQYAVDVAPKRDGFVLYGRKPEDDIHFGKDTPVLISMASATHVIDLDSEERHLCTSDDLAKLVRLMDALPNISAAAALANPQEVPRSTVNWYALAILLKNCSKPFIIAPPGAGFVRDAIKMAGLAVGGEDKLLERPFIYFNVLVRCPFQIDRLSLEALIELCRYGFPAILGSGPILGATGPATMAAGVAQVHAEMLAGIVLTQLIRPGNPVVYASTGRIMDMRTGNVSMAGPEFSILKGAAGQMGRYLGLPVKLPAFLRDAKVLDAQAGFETGTVGLVSALAGDIINGMQFDMDLLVDFADLVFSDEAMAAIKRIVRGFTVDDNSLALDVIKQVGPGGNFLKNKHTLRNFRSEFWMPRLMDRRGWTAWYADGHKDIAKRARERAREILAEHQPERLAPEVEAELDRMAREATISYA
ncbi:MAG: trimethylamine methyltransferase family protein [Chloroflexi bacterium]|nr:trimethylamine methyltransferase family protein [Chloroflexota bacterium]